MKKIFTLIIISLFAITVIGQSEKTKTRDYHNPLKQNRFQTPENRKDNRPEFEKFRRYGQIAQKPVQLKSSRDTKKALDSITSESPGGSKSAFLYDDNGNNTLHTQFDWDADMNEWFKAFETEYDYDGNGNLTHLMDMYRDFDGKWVGYENIEYVYDVNEKLTQRKDYLWVDSTGTWVDGTLTEYTYDTDGSLEQSITSQWIEDQWVVQSKSDFTYDNNGILLQSIGSLWENDEWKIGWKDDYTYDNNGDLTQLSVSQYFISEWIEALKYEYTYDTDGNMTLESETWYDIFEQTWTLLLTIEYVFDNNGNMIEMINTDYDWEEKYKSEFNFNNDYSRENLLVPYIFTIEFPELFNHMVTGSEGFIWNEATQQWISMGTSTLHYSDHIVSGIPGNTTTDIKIYPNPASDFIYFELSDNSDDATVEIFDMQGRKVVIQEISGKQQISVSHLDKGLYIYKLVQNGIAQSGKIMIE
jgi:hypothetical protein